MAQSERDPFHEDPKPAFVEVDAADLETAWDGEGNDEVVCPGCKQEPKGRFAERGTSDSRDWVAFAPCGHVAVLAGWVVY